MDGGNRLGGLNVQSAIKVLGSFGGKDFHG